MNNLEAVVETDDYQLGCEDKAQLQKEMIIKKIKERGFRLTNQRKIILDIILQNDCDSCKAIYYKAIKKDPQIGLATVYRIINVLEDIGTINRRNLYKVTELES